MRDPNKTRYRTNGLALLLQITEGWVFGLERLLSTLVPNAPELLSLEEGAHVHLIIIDGMISCMLDRSGFVLSSNSQEATTTSVACTTVGV
jgi:hypothetical protein